jgi:pimeloyl-[acyl-carrier protein] methyl ester esterase
MQTVWKVNGNSKLLLFFSGWAMDENPTAHLKHEGFDLCSCFDYTNLETSAIESWRSYPEIVLVAWSTGVWAAEQVLGKLNLSFSEAIAINGTPTTVHDETGIPRVIFQGTYDNLSPQTMQKFLRRMMGSAAAYNSFAPLISQRTLEGQKEELANVLSVDFETLETGLIKWDKAIVGTDDAIFPFENQLSYWSCRRRDAAFCRDAACRVSTGYTDDVVEIIEIPIPHYPFLNCTDFFLNQSSIKD